MQEANSKPTTPTRRSALGFSAAALLAGLTTPALAKAPHRGAPSGADAELIALVDRIMANGAEIDRISEEIDQMSMGRPEDSRKRYARHESEIRPLVSANWDLRMELAEARATTIEGFRAKARVVQAYSNCGPGYADSYQDDAMAWSLANDLLGVASIWRSEDEGEAA